MAKRKAKPAKTYQLTCCVCGETFTAKRSHAKTCGSKCRKALSEANKSQCENVPENVSHTFTDSPPPVASRPNATIQQLAERVKFLEDQLEFIRQLVVDTNSSNGELRQMLLQLLGSAPPPRRPTAPTVDESDLEGLIGVSKDENSNSGQNLLNSLFALQD